ncbi:hypothetical protein V1499_22735 [Neobacillus sp. SCS-31]|uniref:hypothetical protein n=1 Tax=Neobacillus oceani TaxID=3115292 RepID=UPI003906C959
MKAKIIKINDLHINEENPRDEFQEDEAAAIKILFKSEKKLFNLMKSIAEYGFEISERIIVVEQGEQNNYLVMDGNRRITCIKLLNNPQILPVDIRDRERLIKRIKKIKEDFNFTPISSVDCVIYDIPAEETLMRKTIQNKHTGENNGAGRLPWDYKAQNRFMNDDYKNYLVDFLDNILKVERSLSTMERIFSDPDLRTQLGVIINKKIPEIKLINSDSEQKIFYILQLLKNKEITVSDVYYKEDREDFYKKYFIENINWRNIPILTTLSIDKELGTRSTKLDQTSVNKLSPTVQGNGIENIIENQLNQESPLLALADQSKVNESVENNKEDSLIMVQPSEEVNNQKDLAESPLQPYPLETIKQQKPENISYLFQGIVYHGEHPGIKRSLFELHRLSYLPIH